MFGKKKNSPAENFSLDFENSVSGVEKVTRKRGKKIAIISGATAAVFVGGGIAAYNLSPFVKNQVRLRVMKPENYYAWVNEENAKSLSKRISESYDKGLTRMEEGQHSSIRLDYEPTEEAKQRFLDEMELSDDYDLTDDERQIRDCLLNTDKLGLSLDSRAKLGDMMFTIAANRNDDQLVSLDILMDNGSGDYFARVPELTEQWLGISMNELIGSDNEDIQKFRNTYQDVLSNPREYLSPEELEEEITRYVDVWNDTVEKVRLEKSEEVTIGDIEVKYTVATVKIDQELAYDISENFIDSAKDDDILRELFVEKLDLVSDDEYDEFLEEMRPDRDDDYESDESISFKTYIDPKGVIRGFEVREDADNKFIAIIGKDGDTVCGEMSFTDGGEKEFEVNLYAEETGKEEYSGNIDLISYSSHYDLDADEMTPTSEKYTLEFEDFKITNEERKYFDADVTIITPDLDPIELEFDGDDDSQSVSYEIVVDDVDYGKATLTWSTEDGADVPVPDKNDCFMIDEDSIHSADYKTYVDRDHMKNFIKELLIKLDIDASSAEDYAEEAVTEIYDEDLIDDIYDDFDDDDFEDDWDDDLDDDDWDDDNDIDWENDHVFQYGTLDDDDSIHIS